MWAMILVLLLVSACLVFLAAVGRRARNIDQVEDEAEVRLPHWRDIERWF